MIFYIPPGVSADRRYPERRCYIPHYYIGLTKAGALTKYVGLNNPVILNGLKDPKTNEVIKINGCIKDYLLKSYPAYLYDERYSNGRLIEEYFITKAQYKLVSRYI